MTDLYRQLLYQLEIDRGLGVQFLPRVQQTANEETAQAGQASLPAIPETGSPEEKLASIAQHIADCRRCGLCAKRKQTVPGAGRAQPDILFIGEGPGAEEDKQGLPFVGAAGQLLGKMIQAMGLSRDEVFICNVIKCRPPGNRTPEEDEITACLPWLEQQVQVLQPKIICTLGNTPLRALKNDHKAGITRLRGQAFLWKSIPVIPTFHPSYLLRNQEAKKPCWEDLKLVLEKIGRPLT